MNYLQEIYLLFSFAMKKGFFSSIHDKSVEILVELPFAIL